MSENDKVGYRRPPKHTQFKPGISGNPDGRPITKPRADTSGQVDRDVLDVANMVVKGPNGEDIPMVRAVAMTMAKAALKGNATAGKVFLERYEQACRNNVARLPDLAQFDEIDLDRVNRRRRSKKKMRMILKRLAKRSQTR